MSNFSLWLRGGFVGETTDSNSAITATTLAAYSSGAVCTVVDEEDGGNGSVRYVVNPDGVVEPLGMQARG